MATLGHCVEFNVGGGVIQDQRSAKCNDTFPKCDNIYDSVDAYKCNTLKKTIIMLFMYITFCWRTNALYKVAFCLLKRDDTCYIEFFFKEIVFKLVILNKKE